MKEPEVLIDRAIATIGNAKIYGTVTKDKDEITFIGGRFKLKKPLKCVMKTMCDRMQGGATCAITSVRTDLTWSTKDGSNLISYTLTINPYRSGKVSFTLKENKCF